MRDQLLGKIRGKVVGSVTCPEWGEVKLRNLSLQELDVIEAEGQKNPVRAFAWMVLFGVSDDAGDRVFHDDDFAKILEADYEIVAPIGEAVGARLLAQRQAIEAAKKNSNQTAASNAG